MTTRLLPRALLLCLAAVPALPLLATAPAAGVGVVAVQDVPDTTPPQVDLDPCHGSEPCQRPAVVYGWLDEGDDLAVLGALVDGEPVAETVYDDGSGFVPHGWFRIPGFDVVVRADYALAAPVPPGEHEVTFYARDLAGNETSRTTTVLGIAAPGRPVRLRATERPARGGFELRWRGAPSHGSLVHSYRVRHAGKDRWTRGYVPSGPDTRLEWFGLRPGRHTFRVRATNSVGEGRAATLRVYLHRR